MRLIDADELIEHVWRANRDKLDTRESITKMIEGTPTVIIQKENDNLKAQVEYLSRENYAMRAEIKALAFAIKCQGVSGNEVNYEIG